MALLLPLILLVALLTPPISALDDYRSRTEKRDMIGNMYTFYSSAHWLDQLMHECEKSLQPFVKADQVITNYLYGAAEMSELDKVCSLMKGKKINKMKVAKTCRFDLQRNHLTMKRPTRLPIEFNLWYDGERWVQWACSNRGRALMRKTGYSACSKRRDTGLHLMNKIMRRCGEPALWNKGTTCKDHHIIVNCIEKSFIRICGHDFGILIADNYPHWANAYAKYAQRGPC